MELNEFLAWLVMGGGAGLFAYWMMGQLTQHSPVGNWPSEYKRYLSFAISALVGMLGYLAMLGMQYAPAPETWRGWIEQLFLYAGYASGLAQLIHGRVDLRQAAKQDKCKCC